MWRIGGGRTRGDLADVGLGVFTARVVPGAAEEGVHADAALPRVEAGLPGAPVGEQHGPAVRPGVRVVLRQTDKQPFRDSCRHVQEVLQGPQEMFDVFDLSRLLCALLGSQSYV